MNQPIGYSWYHSLQTRLEKRFSRGYTFLAAYIWSRTMEAVEFLNPADPMPYESAVPAGPATPLGHERNMIRPAGAGGVFRRRLLNGMMQKQSGAPLGFGDVWTLFTGNPNDVKLPKSQRSVDRWFNTGAGFNRNQAQQLASNVRVSPLRFSGIRADGQGRWDFSAIMYFRLTEKVRTQFRAECLNACNTD